MYQRMIDKLFHRGVFSLPDIFSSDMDFHSFSHALKIWIH